MRDNRDLYRRRIFWPRSERPELLGEVDFDRPCPSCGYNLRGLVPGAACPECGSRDGLYAECKALPWAAEQNPLSFVASCLHVIFRPYEFARQLWSPIRLDLLSARRFRRIAVVVATPVLCVIAFALTAAAVGTSAAWWCLVFNAAAIIVWLNAATLEPVAFFRDKASGKLLKRVEVLAHYAAAPLLLVPLHLLLLPYTCALAQSPGGALPAVVVQVGALMLTMALGAVMVAALTYESIELSRPAALAVTFGAATAQLGSAAVLLVGVPVFAGSVAAKWTAGG